MSEEKNAEKIPFVLNDSTQAALARKYDAEAEQYKAEAQYNRAMTVGMVEEARKSRYEADKAAAEARFTIASETKQSIIIEDQVARILAEDERYHIYQFVTAVTNSTVTNCLDILNKWHRRDDPENPKPWEIHFYSPGGGLFPGMRFFDYLTVFRKTHGHKLTTVSMGHSMSMASILLQAGDVRRMGKESILMIHKGSLVLGGDFDEVKNLIKFIEEKQQKRIIDIFVDRARSANPDTKLTEKYITDNWEKSDWYLDSHDCLDLGIVDEVL